MKEVEAEKIRNYHQQVETANPLNFRDRPDPIHEIRVLHSYNDSVIIEWDKPCANNEEIVLYNINISESRETSEMDMLYQTEAMADQDVASYKLPDLEPN